MKKLLATMLQSAVQSFMSAFTPQQTLVTAGTGAMSMTSGSSRKDAVVRRDQGYIDQLMGRQADTAVDSGCATTVHHASTDLGTIVEETGAPHAVATTVSQRI